MFLLRFRQKHLPHVFKRTLADRPKSQGEAGGISGVATTADAFVHQDGLRNFFRIISFKFKG